MGAVIGVAILTSVLNSYVESHLSTFLTSREINALLQSTLSIDTLAPDLQELVKLTFARGYNIQIRILMGISVGQFLTAILMWKKKKQIVLGKTA
jgi:hypothetical protein